VTPALSHCCDAVALDEFVQIGSGESDLASDLHSGNLAFGPKALDVPAARAEVRGRLVVIE
jgi:hypothetical protein